jgi:hypothetical protein
MDLAMGGYLYICLISIAMVFEKLIYPDKHGWLEALFFKISLVYKHH